MQKTELTSVKYPVVFLVSIARSGSTLVGRMLDMHSQIICVGEMMRVAEAVDDKFPCSCGKQVEECSFWKQHLSLIQNKSKFDYKRFSPGVYRSIAEKSGFEVIFDTSKTRVIRLMNGFLSGRKWKPNDAAFILLLRDPRGVSASAVRGKRNLYRFLKKYIKWMNRIEAFINKRKKHVLILHYENLCRDPEKELKRICQFIGVDFESKMLMLADKTHHFLHSSRSGYMKKINKIEMDERWRHELKPLDISRIETMIKDIDICRDYLPA